jgi:hypothetical protein
MIKDTVQCFTCKKVKLVTECLPVNSGKTYMTEYECNKCRGLSIADMKIVRDERIKKGVIILK